MLFSASTRCGEVRHSTATTPSSTLENSSLKSKEPSSFFAFYLGILAFTLEFLPTLLLFQFFRGDYGLLMSLFSYFKGRNVLLLFGEYSATGLQLVFLSVFQVLFFPFLLNCKTPSQYPKSFFVCFKITLTAALSKLFK